MSKWANRKIGKWVNGQIELKLARELISLAFLCLILVLKTTARFFINTLRSELLALISVFFRGFLRVNPCSLKKTLASNPSTS